jgi:hypothetical protein
MRVMHILFLASASMNMVYASLTPAFFVSLRGVKEEWVIGAEEDTMSDVGHMVTIMDKVKRVVP